MSDTVVHRCVRCVRMLSYWVLGRFTLVLPYLLFFFAAKLEHLCAE